MATDLESLKIAVGVAAGVIAILGTIFGWFGKAWVWFAALIRRKPSSGLIDVPTKTLILLPMSRANSFWWHMGSMNGQPAMQIVGDLNVTNISKSDVVVMGAKLRKPKATGNAIVRAQGSHVYGTDHVIPERGITDLRFDFSIQPPVIKQGKSFKADVAVIDQFGNEHWINGIEFPYT